MTLPFFKIAEQNENPLQLTLYVICHHRKYCDTMYAVMSDHLPTEGEIIADVLKSSFEPSEEDYITVSVVNKIPILTRWRG